MKKRIVRKIVRTRAKTHKVTQRSIRKNPRKISKKTITLRAKKPVKTLKKTVHQKKKIAKPQRPTQQAITKDMRIFAVTKMHPETTGVMMHHGIYCVGCHASMFETVEQGAKDHGLDNAKIAAMLKDMNAVIHEKK